MICLVICSEGKEAKVRQGEEGDETKREAGEGAVGMWVDSATEQYDAPHT